jgi:hypothetical protein
MRILLTCLSLLAPLAAWCKDDSARACIVPFKHNTIIATASVGFIDLYRRDYEMSTGFEKDNTTGFLPLNAKLEYAFNNRWGIAASFSYDNFQYNFNQLYTGYNGPIRRPRANTMRLYSGGLIAYYHLHKVIRVRNLDPFVGVGIALNNISYSAWPQGDSTVTRKEHTATPYLKAGARYYISNNFSVFGDVGYEKQCLVSVGFSARFWHKGRVPLPKPELIKD